MIKKLRRKFILINMLLIFLVLAVVFSILCYSSYRKYENDTFSTLERLVEFNRDGREMPKAILGQKPGGANTKAPYSIIPSFLVLLNEDQSIAFINSENQTTVTEELAKEAADAALESKKERGKLRELSLTFLLAETPDGIKIAFADNSHEADSMQSLVLTSCLILLGSMAAFFLISLFLSRWALAPVEKTWQQQNQFIADASHELKTPLTVILANLRILLAHGSDTIEFQSRWIESTQEEASRMKKLVENLLFLARSEANTVPMVTNRFSFSDTVWGCLLPFESVAFEQGVTFTEEIAPDLIVNGDESQLRQLVAILLDNACKYAGKDKKVTVTLTRKQDKACLSVHNSGDPIPSQDLPHLFERFYRSDKSRARTEGGYGLGLSIAETIVKNHRGRIQAQSSDTEGTTFTVWIPLC